MESNFKHGAREGERERERSTREMHTRGPLNFARGIVYTGSLPIPLYTFLVRGYHVSTFSKEEERIEFFPFFYKCDSRMPCAREPLGGFCLGVVPRQELLLVTMLWGVFGGSSLFWKDEIFQRSVVEVDFGTE